MSIQQEIDSAQIIMLLKQLRYNYECVTRHGQRTDINEST